MRETTIKQLDELLAIRQYLKDNFSQPGLRNVVHCPIMHRGAEIKLEFSHEATETALRAREQVLLEALRSAESELQLTLAQIRTLKDKAP